MENLLIVEDSKTFAMGLKMASEQKDKFIPYIATSFNEAKELVEKNRFFCAILDLILPDALNGEIVDLILSKNIPAIVLTSNIEETLRAKIISKPIVDYVVKKSIGDIDSCIDTAETLLYINRKKALVVDDSKTSRSELKSFFEYLLFDVYEAKDGFEALEILKLHPDIKIATIDYEMPGMNGVEVAQKIRHEFHKEHLVILGITMHSSSEVRSSFLKSGIDDYLPKPITKEEFNSRVIHHMKLLNQYEDIKTYTTTIDKYIPLSITDLDGNIKYISRAYSDIIGYSKKEIVGKNHNIVRDKTTSKDFYENLWSTIQNGKVWKGEIRNRKKDGSILWMETIIEPILDTRGKVVEYRAVRYDITDKKRIEEIAITDGLTGLYNRRFYNEIIAREIKRDKRDAKVLSFIMMDVDHFKQYNDTYGHQEGDRVLIAIATLLKDTLKRATDFIFRMGGEEFGILFSDLSEEEALVFANKIREDIEGLNIPHEKNSVSDYVTASLGLLVTDLKHDVIDEDGLYKMADVALYRAKKEGRNRVVIHQKDELELF